MRNTLLVVTVLAPLRYTTDRAHIRVLVGTLVTNADGNGTAVLFLACLMRNHQQATAACSPY